MTQEQLAAIDVRPEVRVRTDEELQALIDRITFRNATLDFNWRFRFKPYYEIVDAHGNAIDAAPVAGGVFPAHARKAGWLMWVEFERPDIRTGQVGVGRGRYEVVEIGDGGAWEGSVIKTCWVLYEMIIKHEAMEGFRVDDMQPFNPHNTVPELLLAAQIRRAKGQE